MLHGWLVRLGGLVRLAGLGGLVRPGGLGKLTRLGRFLLSTDTLLPYRDERCTGRLGVAAKYRSKVLRGYGATMT